MKFSLALPILAVGAMAAPALVEERGNSDAAALKLAANLPAVKADTESGKQITLIQLDDGVYDPATGEWVPKEQVEASAAEDGNDNEKRTLGWLFGGLRHRYFGGYRVQNVVNVQNNYYGWGNGPWTVRPHDWCNACVSYAGNRGGYAVFDTSRRVRVWGPVNRYWGRW